LLDNEYRPLTKRWNAEEKRKDENLESRHLVCISCMTLNKSLSFCGLLPHL
jgi:hypothetical protein